MLLASCFHFRLTLVKTYFLKKLLTFGKLGNISDEPGKFLTVWLKEVCVKVVTSLQIRKAEMSLSPNFTETWFP